MLPELSHASLHEDLSHLLVKVRTELGRQLKIR